MYSISEYNWFKTQEVKIEILMVNGKSLKFSYAFY